MIRTRLSELRRSNKLSVDELATKMNMDPMVISLYEKESLEMDLSTMIKFSKFFNTSTDYFLHLSNLKSIQPDDPIMIRPKGVPDKNNIAYTRRINNLSQNQLAILSGVKNSPSISNLESYRYDKVGIYVLELISMYFHSSVDYLMGVIDRPIFVNAPYVLVSERATYLDMVHRKNKCKIQTVQDLMDFFEENTDKTLDDILLNTRAGNKNQYDI